MSCRIQYFLRTLFNYNCAVEVGNKVYFHFDKFSLLWPSRYSRSIHWRMDAVFWHECYQPPFSVRSWTIVRNLPSSAVSRRRLFACWLSEVTVLQSQTNKFASSGSGRRLQLPSSAFFSGTKTGKSESKNFSHRVVFFACLHRLSNIKLFYCQKKFVLHLGYWFLFQLIRNC